MSSLFNAIKVTVKKIETKVVDRKPQSVEEIIAEHVPCRITGTFDGGTRLFIHKKTIDTYLPNGLHKNYRIVVETSTNSTYIQQYTVAEEPIWAGGKVHHLEVALSLEV